MTRRRKEESEADSLSEAHQASKSHPICSALCKGPLALVWAAGRRTHRAAGSAVHPPLASCHSRSCCCSSCPSCPGWPAHCLRNCHSQSWSRSKTCLHTSSPTSGSNCLERQKRGCAAPGQFPPVPLVARGEGAWQGEGRSTAATSAQLGLEETSGYGVSVPLLRADSRTKQNLHLRTGSGALWNSAEEPCLECTWAVSLTLPNNCITCKWF